MPATCPTCGEEALTDNARYCVGCGGPLPEVAQPSLRRPPLPPPAPPAPDPAPAGIAAAAPDPEPTEPGAPAAAPAPPPPPPPPPAPPRDDTPRFEPRPAPSRHGSGRESVGSPDRFPPGTGADAGPPRTRRAPERRRTSAPAPMVPAGVVIVGILALVAMLAVLLLIS